MKIDNVFSITNALISNDEDPSRQKSRNRGTQRNMKVWNAKNMAIMIKLEPKRTRTEKTMLYGSPKFLDFVRICKWWKLCSKNWSTNYCIRVVLEIKTRVNLIYYNSWFDTGMKRYNGSKLQPLLISYFF